jgi:PAS domain S-box-containing protein
MYWILAGILFLLLETVLVAMLLVERRRGRQARSFLERRFAIERVVSECATRLSECTAEQVNGEIGRGLGELLESEKSDWAGFFFIDDSGPVARPFFSIQRPGIPAQPEFYNRRELPWITKKLLSGRYVTVARLSDLPLQAQGDKKYLEQRGVCSVALIPSSHAASRCVLVVVRLSERGEWPAALTGRLNVLGNVFANALARKEAQDARYESDERFRYLFTEAPIGIGLGDMDGNVLFANPSMCSMLGYTEEEIRARGRHQFADPEDEERGGEPFQKMKAGLIRTYQIEKRYTRKDGTPMWGRLNVSMLNSSGPRPLVLATLEDITERRFALEELQRAHAELQQFTPRLISAQEDERRRISRELHDDIGQRLALLRIELEMVEQKMPIEDAGKREEVRALLAQLDELVVDVHNLSHQLHSSKLQHLGLSAALREVCQQLGSQHHIQINLSTGPLPESLPEQFSLCFYRVAQEGLANAVKHSGASRVDVSLTYERGVLHLRIRDFGVGFEPKVPGNGIGLVTMQERLKIIGGVLRFQALPEGGTELDAQASVDGIVASARVA